MHSLTPEEWAEFSILLENTSMQELEDAFITVMKEEAISEIKTDMSDEQSFEKRLQEILTLDKTKNKISRIGSASRSNYTRLMKWCAAVASIIIILFVSNYLWNNQVEVLSSSQQNEKTITDFTPGKDGGVLTLESGETVILDDLPEGKIVSTSNDNIAIRVNRSEATYSIIQQKPALELLYQQIETPKGRRFKVGLSDGTQIWLNAGSKLRYPLQFAEDRREVFLSGEAYFEVAHNPKKPFRVHFENMKDSHIEVLGTKFNVSNYSESDGITTSLIQGKVRIHNKGNVKILNPGDVVKTYGDGNIKLLKNDDLNQSTAWKDNYFHFDQADIRTLMTELSRWYDFEIVLPDTLPEERYSGKIGKDLTFNQVVKILSGTSIKYTLEPGRKVIINK